MDRRVGAEADVMEEADQRTARGDNEGFNEVGREGGGGYKGLKDSLSTSQSLG